VQRYACDGMRAFVTTRSSFACRSSSMRPVVIGYRRPCIGWRTGRTMIAVWSSAAISGCGCRRMQLPAGVQHVCRTTPGGQRRFSNLAVEVTLTLGALHRLPLRQTEGFIRSLIEVMQLDLAVLDHTTLARRRRTIHVQDYRWPRKGPVDIVIDSTGLKFFGAGEWARTKHGETRRSWRKLHISANPESNEIIAHELTDDDTSDAAMIGDLVASSGGNIRSVTADGAYDAEPVYQAIRSARPARSPPKIVIQGSTPWRQRAGAPRRRDRPIWPNGLATTTRIRQAVTGRKRHLPYQTHQ
jgi:Transposase DDE domain